MRGTRSGTSGWGIIMEINYMGNRIIGLYQKTESGKIFEQANARGRVYEELFKVTEM